MADYRRDIQDVNDGRYSNVLLFLAVGVLLYIIARGWMKAKQETLSDAIGSDQSALFAQQLRQAFIPLGFPVGMGFDGTDVPAVMNVAGQITDYTAVASAYRTLYNADLSNDLSEELSIAQLAEFWRLVNTKKTTTTTGTTTKPATTTSQTTNTTGSGVTVLLGKETAVASLVNKTCIAKQAVNKRLYKEPNYSEGLADKGDNVGIYVAEADLTINGSKSRFAHVKKPALYGLYYVDYWIHKDSLTFV
ncbi:hypothetical protein GCM10028807_49980 [Spirosoma daeguense]